MLKIDLEPCVPPIWATTGHAQTILAHLLPSAARPPLGQALRVDLDDGDILIGTIHQGSSNFVVLLFHGLGGSLESGYIRRAVPTAQNLGHTVIAINHRGCGAGRGLARYPHHSGRGDDLSKVIGIVRERFAQKKIIAVGFSLGANALLTLLTGQRGTELPDFALAVNGPSDLAAASQRLQRGFNRVYDLNFVQSCRKEIYFLRDQGLIDFKTKISRTAYLHDIDNLFTAPFGGFEHAADYYEQCSTFNHFDKIRVPTVILMSKDDPFIPWEPYLNAQGNPSIDLHLLDHGGHMGYLAQGKAKYTYRRWLDGALTQIFSAAPQYL